MEVRLHATLRPQAGGGRVELPDVACGTVRGLIDALVERFPGLRDEILTSEGELARHVNVFVDGRSVRFLPRRLDTPVADGTRVDVFPPVAGG